MPYYRGVAAKVLVYAYDKTTGLAKTGDTANITAYISKNGATGVATNDANPAPVANMDGYYGFDMAAAEMTANVVVILPVSTTANILIDRKEILTTEAPFLLGTVSDAGTTTIKAITDLTGLGNDLLNTNSLIAFRSGNLKGLARPIVDYISATGEIGFAAFPAAPDNASEFIVIGYTS